MQLNAALEVVGNNEIVGAIAVEVSDSDWASFRIDLHHLETVKTKVGRGALGTLRHCLRWRSRGNACGEKGGCEISKLSGLSDARDWGGSAHGWKVSRGLRMFRSVSACVADMS